MSSVKEKADLEAVLAENELDEAEAERVRELANEGATPNDALATVLEARQPAEELEPDEAAIERETGEPSPRRRAQLEHHLEEHFATVREILGPFADGLTVCEVCGGLGAAPENPAPPEHDNFKACPTCHGWGKVKTGSLNSSHAERDCPRCYGRGYLERLDAGGNPVSPQDGATSAPVVTPAPVVEQSAEGAAGDADGTSGYGVPAWMGDPNLGR